MTFFNSYRHMHCQIDPRGSFQGQSSLSTNLPGLKECTLGSQWRGKLTHLGESGDEQGFLKSDRPGCFLSEAKSVDQHQPACKRGRETSFSELILREYYLHRVSHHSAPTPHKASTRLQRTVTQKEQIGVFGG